jgi:hypothetical protein
MPLVRSVLVVAAIAAAAAASIDRNVTVAQVVNERYEGEVAQSDQDPIPQGGLRQAARRAAQGQGQEEVARSR